MGEFSALQYEGAGQQGAALLILARHPASSPKPASFTSYLFCSQGPSEVDLSRLRVQSP